MTIPRLQAVTRYQRENPPLHMMVAAYLGIGQKKEEAPPESLLTAETMAATPLKVR